MNTKQLQYAIELSKTKNFSLASEKLNISQPALSKQILSLEKELGVKLFDRNNVPIKLTPAGEHFIREIQALLYQEEQLIHSLDQFKDGMRGRLVIGISPFRNLTLIPKIIPMFKERYPGIQVVLQEAPSDRLRKEAEEGKYDFAVVTLPVNDSVLDVTLLDQEQLVLAIPDCLLYKLPDTVCPGQDEIDFSACKELPFVVLSQSQEMRRYFDQLCAACNITPDIAVEVSGGLTTAWSMARTGIGATLLPLPFVRDRFHHQNLTLFNLKNTSFTRQPAIVTRRGQYLSEPAKYFMQLLIDAQR